MNPIEELVSLFKNTLVPQLHSLSKNVKSVSDDVQAMRLDQQRHQGKIEIFEERFQNLKCSENTDILRSHGSRIAKLEDKMEAGHKLNEACKAKNLKVDEALRLAESNKKTNEEQELRHKEREKNEKERHAKIVNRLWALILVIVGAAATAYFSGFFTHLPKP